MWGEVMGEHRGLSGVLVRRDARRLSFKQASGLARGADRPGHETVATISLKHLHEIAMVSAVLVVCVGGGGTTCGLGQQR